MKRCIYEKVYLLVSILFLLPILTYSLYCQPFQENCIDPCEGQMTWSGTQGFDVELGDITTGYPRSDCDCTVHVRYKLGYDTCFGQKRWEIRIEGIDLLTNCFDACTSAEMMNSIVKILLHKAWLEGIFNAANSNFQDPDYRDFFSSYFDIIRIRIPACWIKTWNGARYIPCDTTQCCIVEYSAYSPGKRHDDEAYPYPKFNTFLMIDVNTVLAYTDTCPDSGCAAMCDAIFLDDATSLGWYFDKDLDDYFKGKSIVKELNNIKLYSIVFDCRTNSIIINNSSTKNEGNNIYLICLYDVTGVCVYSQNLNELKMGKNEINIPNISNGVYFVLLKNNNKIISQSIILKY